MNAPFLTIVLIWTSSLSIKIYIGNLLREYIRYVKSTIDHCITFTWDPNGLKLLDYCDSDLGSSQDRRSTTGYCFTLNVNGCALS